MDEKLKSDFGELCENIGMNITTAFTVFAKKAVAEQRIPFELSVKPCETVYDDKSANK